VRPAPRGGDSGWPGNGGDPRRGVPGRGQGGPPRDGADPRRTGYGGAPGAGGAGLARGNGRPEPDPRRQGRSGLAPGAPAERTWGTPRGTGPVPRGAGGPGGAPPAGPDGFRAGRPTPNRGPTPVDPRPGLRPGPTVRRLGTLPARAAALILIGTTLLGVAATVVTHKEPGALLGFFVIIGGIIAAFIVRRGRLHILIPLPALVLFCGAVVTGAIHDRSVDTSTTEMGVNFLQWIAGVFFPMCAATILVLVIAGGRWLLSRQLVSGQFQMSDGRDGGRPGRDGRGGGRDNRDPWADRRAPADPGQWNGGRRDNRDNIEWGNGNRRGDPRDPRNNRSRPGY